MIKYRAAQRETLQQLIEDSFKKSVQYLIDWKNTHSETPTWASLRDTEIPHLLRIEPFGAYDVRIGGNQHIINAVNEGATALRYG